MHIALKPIKEILQLNAFMYNLTFDGLDEKLARRQLQPNANSLTWLLGHTATSRFYIGELMGLDSKSPWGDLFNGSITKADQTKFPPLTEIRQAWDGVSTKVMAELPKLDEAKLIGPLPGKFPTEEQTVLAGLSFMSMHEAYHVGQISTQRRLLGIDSLFDLAVRKMKEQ